MFEGWGFRVWGLGLWDVEFRVWGVGFRVQGFLQQAPGSVYSP